MCTSCLYLQFMFTKSHYVLLGFYMDMRTDLMPMVCGHHSRKKKRRILEGVAVRVAAVAVWFNNSYIEMSPREDYVLLREHI